MKLQEDENVIKSFYHHPFPFFIQAVKTAIVSFPFYFVASFFASVMDAWTMFAIYFGIAAFFALIIVYSGVVYFLDRLVVTNKRVVHVNWKTIFDRQENESDLSEIQDIETSEFGILSEIPLFDYGTFQLMTAAKTSVIFKLANDPEGIKHFIYHLERKPSKIMSEDLDSQPYDRTFAKQTQEDSVSGPRG